ncbi:transposase insH for insertion sequence element IS5Y, partial [Escherichia coli KTE120]
QEQRAATRSGDASDQERQSVALWHEGPHWCRCQEWPDPQPSHHRGNEHDLNQLGNLLHGEEQFVSADAGYQGAPQREELAEVDVDWLIAERPGKVKTLKQHPRKNKTAINIEYMKASIRAKVEHPFRIIKRQFGFVKARYKGLLKNDNQLAMLFTLANLFRVDQMIRQWERSQ